LHIFSRHGLSACFLLALGVASTRPAYGSLIITSIFDSTIINDPNAALIEGTINSALAVYMAKISTNITVVINFAEMVSGLGQSSTYFSNISYSAYRAALAASAADVTDSTALAHLPGGPTNPVDGSTIISVTTANLRALGINVNPPAGQPDSFVGLNTSLMNLDRNSTDPSKYDLMAVVSHEVDEALGFGSGLNGGNTRPEDLFRYAANGTRSYTTSSSASAYFSLNGATDLAQFNQSGGGADYGDWSSSGVAKVQDAFGTPGSTPNLGVELTALDAIGYTLTTPEPGTWALFGFGCVGLIGLKRRIRS
jgi:hypothetical protein